MDSRRVANNKVKICAVVKANAYGFGLIRISNEIKDVVDFFAVARICEALSLRKAGITNRILVLSPIIDNNDISKAIKYNLDISVDSKTMLDRLETLAEKQNKLVNIHLQVDTGMNRYGLSIESIKKILCEFNNYKCINFFGVYSHLACPCDNIISLKQKEKFDEVVKLIREYGYNPMCHLSSSKKSYESAYFYDMIRLGIDLYENVNHVSFSGNVIEIRNLKAGECIGYEHTFKASRDMRIAIVDIGYGDISIRKLSNKGHVLIAGKICDIVGNICMDCLFVDVTGIDESLIDKALLFGIQGKNKISICEVADKCGTISYEVLTSISSRVKREYYKNADYYG